MALSIGWVHDFEGFDSYAKPPWQMVPVGTPSKILRVSGVPTGAQLMVTVKDPSLVNAQYNRGNLTLTGHTAGSTTVTLTASNLPPALLDVTVKDKQTLKVAFNYVTDIKGRTTKPKTPATLDALIKTMKDTHLPQNNTEFIRFSDRPVTVNADLGDEVVPVDHWVKMMAQGDPNADYNIVFVWKLKSRDIGETIYRKGTHPGTVIAAAAKGLELAHEAGHFLGRSGHNDYGYLMYESSDGITRRISKEDAHDMNPSGRP
jgi:hypothetical protein